MKLILHPLSIILLVMSGFLVFVETIHLRHHQTHETDVHGYVKQFCRRNTEVCEEILREI